MAWQENSEEFSRIYDLEKSEIWRKFKEIPIDEAFFKFEHKLWNLH